MEKTKTTEIDFSIVEVKGEDKPQDFRGLVAVDEAQNLIVISTTDDCKLFDLFPCGYSPDDNYVDCNESLAVGLYEMSFHPWSEKTYEGDYDGGIKATVIRKIGEIPKEYGLKDTKP